MSGNENPGKQTAGFGLRQLLALLLSLCLLLNAAPLAFALDSPVEGDFGEALTWSLSPDGTLTVSGEGEIPECSSPSDVPWYGHAASVEALEISEGITEIGGYTFMFLPNLRSVDFPASLTNLGPWTFYNDKKLKEISFAGETAAEDTISAVCWSVDGTEKQRVEDVFGKTFWFCLHYPTPLDGVCGDDLTWTLENVALTWYDEDWNVTDEPEEPDYGYSDTDASPAEAVYRVDDAQLHISGYGDMWDFGNGDPAPWADARGSVTSLVIDDGVTSVGSRAFYGFYGLREAEIGNDVAVIGDEAFNNCERLTSISLPGVQVIGESAFAHCAGYDYDEQTGERTQVGLETVALSDSLQEIDAFAFEDDALLTDVDFRNVDPDAVILAGDRYPGAEGFEDCEYWSPAKRARAVFSGTPWYAERYEQGRCGDNLYWRHEQWSERLYQETDEPVPEEAEWNEETMWICWHDALIISGCGDMYDYGYNMDPQEYSDAPWDHLRDEINELDFEPEGGAITRIGENAFRGFYSLGDVYLPEGLESIASCAFEGCTYGEDAEDGWIPMRGLSHVYIPGSVTCIEREAFANNSFLEWVDLTEDFDIAGACLSIVHYYGGEYEEWTADERVNNVFHDTPWYDGWYAEWYYNTYESGVCGDNLTWRFERWCDRLYQGTDEPVPEEAEWNEETMWERWFNVLIVSGYGDMYDYGYNEETGDYDVAPWDHLRGEVQELVFEPDYENGGITHIGSEAFASFGDLDVIDLPDGVVSVGANAFLACTRGWNDEETGEWFEKSVHTVNLPDSVESLGEAAFGSNYWLETVNFGGDIGAVCLPDSDEDFASRVNSVFSYTAWGDRYVHSNGVCGDNLTWHYDQWSERLYQGTDEPVPEEAEWDEETMWERWHNVLVISGYGDMYDYEDWAVPWSHLREELNELWFEPAEGETITRIGDNAFRWCINLNEVWLPEGLESIGECAFEGCRYGEDIDDEWVPMWGLSHVYIPDSVTSIESDAFANDSFLEWVELAEDYDIAGACMSSGRYGGYYEEWSADDRVNCVFHDTPWYDGWYEGWYHETYETGVCGDDLTWRFERWCDRLYQGTDEPVPEEEEWNEDTMWERWRNVLIVSGFGAMYDYGYNEDTQEYNVAPWDHLRGEVDEIIFEPDYDNGGITHIGSEAFAWFRNLNDVWLPEGVISVGRSAFWDCNREWWDEEAEEWFNDSLHSVNLPDSIEYLDEGAFGENHYLDTVNFGGDLGAVCVPQIEYNFDFSYADRIRAVFSGSPWCDDHTYRYGVCGDNLTWRYDQWSERLYQGTDEPVPEEAEWDEDTMWERWHNVLVISGYGEMTDFGYDETVGDSLDVPWAHLRGEVNELAFEPDYDNGGITHIGRQAFAWFNNLDEIWLPDGLLSVGANAFYGCYREWWDEELGEYVRDSLHTVNLPESVQYLGDGAFADNNNLDAVNFGGDLFAVCLPDSEGDLTERFYAVFRYTRWGSTRGVCGDNLTWRYEQWFERLYQGTDEPVPEEAEWDEETMWDRWHNVLVISGFGDMYDYNWDETPWAHLRDEINELCFEPAEGETITRIGDNAFQGCNHLGEIWLPEGLESIGERAFRDCAYSEYIEDEWVTLWGLSHVYIPGSVTSIERDAFANDSCLEWVELAEDYDIAAACMSSGRYGGDPDEWSADDRVNRVFHDTPWFNDQWYPEWYHLNYEMGVCGDHLEWRFERWCDRLYQGTDEPVPEEEEWNEDTMWERWRNVLIVSGFGDMYDYGYNEDTQEYNVAPWDNLRNEVDEIIFEPDYDNGGITHIGSEAFAWFRNLNDVYLPEGVVSVGRSAFWDCSREWWDEEAGEWYYDSLHSVDLPDSIEYLGEGAFGLNRYFDTVYFSGDYAAVCMPDAEDHFENRVYGVFSETPWGDEYRRVNGTCGDNLTWRYDQWSERLYQGTDEPVPEEAEWDEDTMWERWHNVLVISGSGDMYDYEDWAVPWSHLREELNELWFEPAEGEAITRIGDNAFRWCNNLNEVWLPEGLESIGEVAFEHCVHEEEIDGEWDSVWGLSHVYIPGSVTSIESDAFANDSFLEWVELAEDYDIAGACMSSGRYGGYYEEWSAGDRVNCVFHNSPWYDGWYAEWYHETYEKGVCGDNLTWRFERWCDRLYQGTDEPVPEEEEWNEDTMWERWRNVLIVSGFGAMYDYGNNEDTQEYNVAPWDNLRNDVDEIIFEPDYDNGGITHIGSEAFAWFRNLNDVYLPEGVVSVGRSAFWDCSREWWDEEAEEWRYDSLHSVNLPDSIEYLDESAFGNNHYLDTVNFGGDLGAVCATDSEEDYQYRVYSVFSGTPWGDEYVRTHGVCGDNLTWRYEQWPERLYQGTDEPVPEEAEWDEDTMWERWHNVLVISGSGDMNDYYWDDVPWDHLRGEVNELRFEPAEGEAITRIGDRAFRWFGNLREVWLPDGLESIGEYAFEHCAWYENEGDETPADSLRFVFIPETVTSIETEAFANNPYLYDVAFPEGFDVVGVSMSSARYGGEYDDWVGSDRVRHTFNNTPWYDEWYHTYREEGRCGDNLFWRFESWCETLYQGTDEPVPEGVAWNEDTMWSHWFTVLVISGYGAMDDYLYNYNNGEWDARAPWEHLRDRIDCVVFEPDYDNGGITHIGDFAFCRMPWLNSVELPEGVVSIGEYAFNNCERLQRVVFPATLEYIGTYAFENCCHCGYDEEHDRSIIDGGLSEIVFAEESGLKYIGVYAFASNPLLEAVELPDGLEEIDEYAFLSCCWWGYVDGGERVMGGLRFVRLPAGLNAVNDGAFSYNDCLEDVVFDDYVSLAGACMNGARYEGGYNGWTAQDRINQVFRNTPWGEYEWRTHGQCGENAYWQYDQWSERLYQGTDEPVPEEAEWDEETMWERWHNVLTITGSGAIDGWYGYHYYDWYDVWNSLREQVNELVFAPAEGEAFTRIGDGAFSGFSHLRELYLPEGLESVGESAFEGCAYYEEIDGNHTAVDGLRFVSIPATVASIEYAAFAGNALLESVECAEGYEIGAACMSANRYGDYYAYESDALRASLAFNQTPWLFAAYQIDPVVLTQPEDTVVAPGDRVYFTVEADGVTLSYQWQYSSDGGEKWSNVTIDSAYTPELNVAGVAANTRLLYRCVVSNAYGTVYSDPVCFQIAVPPTILTQPTDVEVKSGERAYFSVEADGTDLAYQWQYSSNGGETWRNSTAAAAKTATLSIAGIAANTKLIYRCVISNIADTVYTDSVRMTIAALPTITAQPTNAVVTDNSRAKFTVAADGADLTYQWQYSSNGTKWSNSSASSAKTATLDIKGTASNAKLQYRCVITAAGGSVYTDTVRVIISNIKPVIVTQPTDTTVTNNSRAKFSVTASGLDLTYQWQYSSNGTKWSNSSASSAKTAILDIKGTASNAKLQYRCAVTNAVGTTYTNSVRVIVSDIKPIILTQPTDTTVKLNERAYFSVKVSGVDVTYQWQWSSNGGSTWKNSTASAAKTADLSIAGTAGNAKLLYRCVIANAYGTVTTNTVRVSLSDGKPVILAQPVNTTVKLNERAYFSVVVSGADVTYQWQYSSNGGSTWKNSTASAAQKADFSIAGTTSNAKLLYHCVITNAYGSVTTDAVRATIADAKPVILTQPTDTTVESGVRAYFTVVASGVDVTYQWQYSSNGGSTWKNSTAAAAKTNQLSIAGNPSNAKLLYRCAVTNAMGTTYTNTVRVTISDIAPIILTQPTDTTVELNKRAYFSVKVSGADVTYQWQWSSNGGETWKDSTASAAKTADLSIAGTAGNAKLLYRCVVTNAYGTVYTNQVKATLTA